MKAMKKTPEKILNTAFDCLGERGYANVSMRDIAKQSGTALSQLTYYFETKEGLFLEVINMMTDRYLTELRNLMKQTNSATKKRGALSQFFKDLAKDDPKLLRLFVDFTAQAMWIPSFKQKMEHLFSQLTRIIDSEIVGSEKEIPMQDSQEALSTARMIFGTLYGLTVQMMLGGEENFSANMFDLATLPMTTE